MLDDFNLIDRTMTDLYTTLLLPSHLDLAKLSFSKGIAQEVLPKSATLFSLSGTGGMIMTASTTSSTTILDPFARNNAQLPNWCAL
jgi:hypothetical protein